MQKVSVAVVGLGKRGSSLLRSSVLTNPCVDVAAVCDGYAERASSASDTVLEACGKRPFTTQNYKDILEIEDIDAVIVSAGWESHVQVAIDAMCAKKRVAIEVGGSYSVEDCLRLVRTSEDTGIPCMMLENCCYGKTELMVLNMARAGMFGEIVHCAGGYIHDLRKELITSVENKHYRQRNYIYRNCDNYPTHALGPIAKILNINRGNRMLSLTSTASKAVGMHEYALSHYPDDKLKVNEKYNQGDVVTTVIRCANGETIRLTLNTTLPVAYSRDFTVCGTKGGYTEMTDSIFLDGVHNVDEELEFNTSRQWGNAEEYREKNLHSIWKKYGEEAAKSGHGGMDYMVISAFIESVQKKIAPPIDVYDTASWMAVSALSEQSISLGGAPVAIPDFTNGNWMRERAASTGEFSLD